jgi:hypothetical protein
MDRITMKNHHQQTLAITRAFDNLAKAASHVRWIFYLPILSFNEFSLDQI